MKRDVVRREVISERAARYLYFDEEQQHLYCGQRGTAKELKAIIEKWDLKLTFDKEALISND